MTIPYRRALIVGAGEGISASFARLLGEAGVAVTLAARNEARLAPIAARLGVSAMACDAADPASVEALFKALDQTGAPDIVLYNPSARVRGPVAELDPEEVRRALDITAFGAFLTVREAARRMLAGSHGAILLTGATAGLKGLAHSAPFAMGKFALRGLAQSAARELGPKGIHVAHINVDGAVRSATRPDPADRPDSTLDPDAIAQVYLDLLRQPRSAWTHELDLRPWVETF